ncbi:MAG: hemolysin III family protein [Deltaproteobacteria bacterium]|nr:hemolysin III family protein [Deltaproteobacteria bacterium]
MSEPTDARTIDAVLTNDTIETTPEPAPPQRSHPTAGEELAHSLTHGVGAVAAVITLVLLVLYAAAHGTALHVAVASIFGASLVGVYVSSTVYHAVCPTRTRTKGLLQILDHAAIHFLIAGTYTPFALVAIGGAWGISLCAIAWSLALVGIVVETTPLRRHARLSMGLYLGAGWVGALGMPFLWSALPLSTLAYLLLGGVAYTAGVPFFLLEGRKWSHTIWHGFVLAGSAFHVMAVAAIVMA